MIFFLSDRWRGQNHSLWHLCGLFLLLSDSRLLEFDFKTVSSPGLWVATCSCWLTTTPSGLSTLSQPALKTISRLLDFSDLIPCFPLHVSCSFRMESASQLCGHLFSRGNSCAFQSPLPKSAHVIISPDNSPGYSLVIYHSDTPTNGRLVSSSFNCIIQLMIFQAIKLRIIF